MTLLTKEKKNSLNNVFCIWKQKHHVKNLNKEAVDLNHTRPKVPNRHKQNIPQNSSRTHILLKHT